MNMEESLSYKRFKYLVWRTGDMVQQLAALAALSKDPGSNPSTHMVVHNCLYLHFQGIWYLHTDIHAVKTSKSLRKEEEESMLRKHEQSSRHCSHSSRLCFCVSICPDIPQRLIVIGMAKSDKPFLSHVIFGHSVC